jgi:predicted DCC family thiol-disulfide oxidoreductase YuxK
VRLPDSVVLRLSDGRLLVRSRAVLEAAHRLGGLWSIAAWAIGLIPLALLDGAYDFAASIRSRLFARPVEACPAVTPELRARFVTR